MKFILRALLPVVVAVALSGCATYKLMAPPPAQVKPVSVVYTAVGPSGWTDLPIGVYRVPNTNVIVSGHQEGGNIGMMFGVLGVLAQDAVETGVGKGKVSGVQGALQIDLVPQAQTITKDLLASDHFKPGIAEMNDPSGPTLEVTPYTVLTFANATDVRPYVFLKATLHPTASSSASTWTTRYIAAVGKPVPLAGDNSLTANDGALLKSMLSDELARAIKAMLTDVASHPARDGAPEVYVETAMPFIKAHMGLVGAQLADDGSTLVYVPKVADANVIAGVEIVDKASLITIRPATADDRSKLLDDGN